MGISHKYDRTGSLGLRIAFIARDVRKGLVESATEFCAKWDNPVDFARNVLGLDIWSVEGVHEDDTQALVPHAGQREFLLACAKYRRVACVSGHRVGKSYGVAILLLWFYCRFTGARAFFTANRQDQVEAVVWRAIGELIARAHNVMRIRIPGSENIYTSAAGGLRDPARNCELRGITAAKPEAMQGLAAEHLLIVVDEASAVAEKIYKALQGNLAADNARMVLIGNPTQPVGTFREAFRSRRWSVSNPTGYYCLHIDTHDSPNVTGRWRELEEYVDGVWRSRSKPVPALAGPDFIAQMAHDYGADSIEFHIRVTGSFEKVDESAIFSASIVEAATARWIERHTDASGRLFIGIDPAGNASSGDNTAFCARLGNCVVEVYERQAMSPGDIVVHVQSLIQQHPGTGKPIILVDGQGPIGVVVYRALYQAGLKGGWRTYNVNVARAPWRSPMQYHRHRDELWGNARDWVLLQDGALPPHSELIRQLQVAQFFEHEGAGPRGSATRFVQAKVTPKDDMREALERSPDLADAFVMCCWVPGDIMAEGARKETQAAHSAHAQYGLPEPGGDDSDGAMDPFSGSIFGGGGGAMDPWGGT